MNTKKKILIVDDMEINRIILAEILSEEYDIISAENGLEALELLGNDGNGIEGVLLDLMMPGMDGYGVLNEMQERDLIKYIPVIVITGERDVAAEKKCFDLGVRDFILKPFNASIVIRRVENNVELFAYKNHLQDKVDRATSLLRSQNKKLHETNIKIIDILGDVVESRNLESGEHVKRVKGFTRILGMQLMKDYPELDIMESQIEVITQAAALHDVGKIAIPDNVLLKPGRFTPEEFEVMKTHTTKGCDILDKIEGIWEDDYKETAYEICRYHHERYDGKGYPDKLAGDDIPLSAQLVSVADVYDALVSERCYKKAVPKEQAFNMIIEGACGVFNPKLMEAFKNARADFEALADTNQIQE